MIFKNLSNYLNKVFFIMNKFGKKKIIFLNMLILLTMLLEVFSISLIIPVMGVIENNDFLTNIFQQSSFIKSLSHIHQIYLIISVLCITFILKTLFVIFLNYYQNKFTTDLQAKISGLLMSQYLYMPYKKYFERNTSELLRNIKDECNALIFGVIAPLLNLFIELLIISGITILLIYQIGLISFMVVIPLLLFALIYIRSTKKTIKELGNKRFSYDEKIIKNANELFYTIRDIKIYFLQNFFLKKFSITLNKFAEVIKKFLTFQILPRLSFELLLIFLISVLLVVFSFQGLNFTKMITSLALIAAASFRIIPSVNRVVTAQQTLRYNIPSVDEIYKEIKSNPAKYTNSKLSKIQFNKQIRLLNINFSYNPNKKILNNLNLIINAKDKIGIIGDTGLGKSTIIDIISGLISPESGEILVDDIAIKFEKKYWGDEIGYVSQQTTLVDDTVKQNIIFGRYENLNKRHLNKVLKEVDLSNFVNKLPNKVNTIIGEKGIKLSGGQKQRLGLARALLKNPKLLILDEAFSALDSKTEKNILNKINKNYKNTTIINIAHKGESLKFCNKIFVLKNGKLSFFKKKND
jgi:ABC-type multidrug transport system fused ATPase/permease subunit